VTPGDGPHQVWRGLETAAQYDADRRRGRRRGEIVEMAQDGIPAPQAFPEPALGLAIPLGQRPRVGLAEQVEDEGTQARPPRRLGQGPAGLGGDEDRPARRFWSRSRIAGPQPATSTASV
jgi:hypothetical protein